LHQALFNPNSKGMLYITSKEEEEENQRYALEQITSFQR